MNDSCNDRDWQLLRRYVNQRSESAFSALVARHIDLVYATCRRELYDTDLVDDTVQAVFLVLARRAASLRSETHLAGWLFQTARFAAKNAYTRELRREGYERRAGQTMAEEQTARAASAWEDIEPIVHGALAHLSAQDREAVLLRFWNCQSLAEVGSALGVSDDAARMRVGRAVDKLRLTLQNQLLVKRT